MAVTGPSHSSAKTCINTKATFQKVAQNILLDSGQYLGNFSKVAQTIHNISAISGWIFGSTFLKGGKSGKLKHFLYSYLP